MKRRVLFTASTYSHIYHFHRPYLLEFRRRGWQVDVACGGAPIELPEADRVIDVPFEKSMTSPKNLAAVRLLHREIRDAGYELISCHTALAAFFTRMAVRGLSHRPIVACTAHGYLFTEQGGVHRFLLEGAEALCAPVTDLLMTMNRWDNAYATAHRLGRTIVDIPGMGLDRAWLPQVAEVDRGQMRRSLGFTERDFLFIYAAEFSKRKNHETLLRALKGLPERAALLLPGDGVLRGACMDLARQLGIEGRVIFPGQVKDLAPWYAAADGAVSASRSEGLPFNLMEAMYCGLPIVASDVKGNCDLIQEGQTGLLYPFADVEGCQAQLRRLLLEQEMPQRLGAAAREAVSRYMLPQVLPQVMAAYERLLPLGEPETVGVSAKETDKGRAF